MVAVTVTESTDRGVLEQEPFYIVCSDNDQGPLMNAYVGIRPSLKEMVRNGEVTQPQLLIVIRKGDREVQRMLQPLEGRPVHVTFPGPGEYTAHAMVISVDKGTSVSRVSDLLLARDKFGYFVVSLANAVSGFHSSFWCEYRDGKTYRTVDIERVQHVSTKKIVVKSENFAKPPARWRSTIARWFFPDNDRDQCQFGRRFWWYTLPLTAFVLPLHYLAKLVGIVFHVLLGFVHGMNMKSAWRPFRNGSFSAVFGGVNHKRSSWFWRYDGRRFIERNLLWEAFVTFVAIDLVLATLGWIFGNHGGWLQAFVYMTLVCAGVAIFLVVMIGLSNFVEVVIDVYWQQRRFKEWRQHRKQERRMGGRDDLDRSLATMSCEDGDGEMTIEQLARRRRLNLVVLYYKAKDRVCKPFAH